MTTTAILHSRIAAEPSRLVVRVSHSKLASQVWEAERQRVRSDAAEALATEQAALKAEAAAEQARLKGQLEGMQKELNDILNDRCVESSEANLDFFFEFQYCGRRCDCAAAWVRHPLINS